jgi:hypothetical protein
MKWFPALYTLAASAALAAAGDPLTAEVQALKSMANAARVDESLLRWRDIPWYTDANAGLKTARAEKRPMLLFVTGDEPLGRC